MTFQAKKNGLLLDVVETSRGGRPMTHTEQLNEIIRLLGQMSPASSIEQVDTGLTPQVSESIISIDVSSVNTNLNVPLSLASRRLTFLSFPPALQQLEARVNRETAQVLDILCDGKIIERSNGIASLFITSRPAIPNGRVRVLVGDLTVQPGGPNCFNYHNMLPLPLQGLGDNQETLNLNTLLPIDGPVSIGHQSDRVSTQNPFTSIPRFTLIRVHGEITSEDQAVAGSIMDFQVRVHTGGVFFWQKNFKGHIGGDQQWQYDSGWFWCDGANDPSFNFIINDIGPVGNMLSINGYLEIIPNIPPV